MTRPELLQFLHGRRLAVQASASSSGLVQAAVIGIAVTDALEIVFDSVDTTRKVKNYRQNPKAAFVIGGLSPGDERTVQYEGIVDVPEGSERERIKQVYLSQYPDGGLRSKWPGLIYARVRPTWIRYSDYNKTPPEIVEFDSRSLHSSE